MFQCKKLVDALLPSVRVAFPKTYKITPNKLDILRNYMIRNTLAGTFILYSSSYQPVVDEGSDVSKSSTTIDHFVTIPLGQDLIFLHTA